MGPLRADGGTEWKAHEGLFPLQTLGNWADTVHLPAMKPIVKGTMLHAFCISVTPPSDNHL